MLRQLKPGDKVRTSYGIPREHEMEGPAFAAAGLSERRQQIQDQTGDVFKAIATSEINTAIIECPNANGCRADLLEPTDDSRYPSDAIYVCPTRAKHCSNIVLNAAARAEARIDKAHKNILAAIAKQQSTD